MSQFSHKTPLVLDKVVAKDVKLLSYKKLKLSPPKVLLLIKEVLRVKIKKGAILGHWVIKYSKPFYRELMACYIGKCVNCGATKLLYEWMLKEGKYARCEKCGLKVDREGNVVEERRVDERRVTREDV